LSSDIQLFITRGQTRVFADDATCLPTARRMQRGQDETDHASFSWFDKTIGDCFEWP
jgi:hypothetical protein